MLSGKLSTDFGEKMVIVFFVNAFPFFIGHFKSAAVLEKMIICDNRIVRCLTTRRKDKMYALASKVNVECDLLIASRGELKFRVWRCFERMLVIS